MLLIVLVSLAVVSAWLTISGEYHGPRYLVYFAKPLAVLLLILLALISKYPVSPFYKYMIVAGLVCSLIGDAFLMLPSDHFTSGLVSFLIAHLFYATAFLFEGNRAFSYWAVLPLAVYGCFMLSYLWRGLAKLKVPVIVYMFALLLMAGIASSRFLITRQGGSLLAAVGAILFVTSDSTLAIDKFRKSFRIAQLLILTTYFVAQCLIALST